MAGFIFDARAALSEILNQTPATFATAATEVTPAAEPSRPLQAPTPRLHVPPAIDLDAFEERSAIAEHDGGLLRSDAETRAARECGFDYAVDLHTSVVARWTSLIG